MRKKGKRSKLLSDDEWVRRQFQKLIKTHPGQYLVVSENEAFIGYDAALLFKEARHKHPGVTPTCMPIPRPEDFLSILIISCPK